MFLKILNSRWQRCFNSSPTCHSNPNIKPHISTILRKYPRVVGSIKVTDAGGSIEAGLCPSYLQLLQRLRQEDGGSRLSQSVLAKQVGGPVIAGTTPGKNGTLSSTI